MAIIRFLRGTLGRRRVTTLPRTQADVNRVIEAHLAGDSHAFGQIVERYQSRLINFVYRMTGDRDRAEELVQDTFLRVHRHLHRFDRERNFSTWIYTIAANLARNELRRRNASLTWFNQPWIGKRLQIGMPVVLSGKIDQYLGRLVMNYPEVEPLEQQNLHTNRIVPVYSLTENITQRWLRKQMYQVVTYWAPRIPDHLPESIRKATNLLDLPAALLQAHFPDSMEKLRSARQRLAFDEIFFLQLGVFRKKHAWQNRSARVFTAPDEWLEKQMVACLFH